jgi:hypothetical protein
MDLEPAGSAVKTPARNFIGDVSLTPIHSGAGPSRMTVGLVRFTPGARTNWHSRARIPDLPSQASTSGITVRTWVASALSAASGRSPR